MDTLKIAAVFDVLLCDRMYQTAPDSYITNKSHGRTAVGNIEYPFLDYYA